MTNKGRPLSTAALFLILLATTARQAAAAPIVDVVVDDLGGVFKYSYTVGNTAGSDDTIFDFHLDFTGDPLNVSAPTGWDFIAGLGFIDFFSTLVVDGAGNFTNPFDIVAGQTLSGFVFESTL